MEISIEDYKNAVLEAYEQTENEGFLDQFGIDERVDRIVIEEDGNVYFYSGNTKLYYWDTNRPASSDAEQWLFDILEDRGYFKRVKK